MHIIHDAAANQFVAVDEDGARMGKIKYTPDGDVLAAEHTWTDDAYRGQGVAGKLLDRLVLYAAEHNLKIRPVCPYVVASFRKNAEKYSHVMYKEKE